MHNRGEVKIIARRNRPMQPEAREALDRVKYEVAEELGLIAPGSNAPQRQREYEKNLDRLKYEVARELGIRPNNGYWGDISSRDCGRVGGRLGGYIGGNMVRKLISLAEEKMAEDERHRGT